MTAQLLAVILGGLLALAGSLIALLVQGRQQRMLAEDARLWIHRAETYLAVLQYQGPGLVEGYRGPRTASEWAIGDELTAKVAAFATDAVRHLWQQSALASMDLSEYVSEDWPEWSGADGYERQQVEADMEKNDTFRKLRQASSEAARRLTKQVRAELNTDHHGPRPRWHRH